MGTMESLKFLASKRYIRDLATLVVAYGISINLVEVTWKSKLKAQVKMELHFCSVINSAMKLFSVLLHCRHNPCSFPHQMNTHHLWVTSQLLLE